MKKSLFVLGVTTLLAASAGAQQITHTPFSPTKPSTRQAIRLMITQQVFDTLGMLADIKQLETVRCLFGAVHADRAVIDHVWKPPISWSTISAVEYLACPKSALVLWHNHPWTTEATPEDVCYLSRTDIEEAMRPHAPPVQIVQVTSQVACWWTRQQIARRGDASMIRPGPSQFIYLDPPMPFARRDSTHSGVLGRAQRGGGKPKH